jgi:hypothetical protein
MPATSKASTARSPMRLNDVIEQNQRMGEELARLFARRR